MGKRLRGKLYKQFVRGSKEGRKSEYLEKLKVRLRAFWMRPSAFSGVFATCKKPCYRLRKT